MKKIFVTGIGTDVGKTIVAAVLTEALDADYWKPIQAGDLLNSDTLKVKELISNSTTKFFPETYRLTQPMSPHAAADIDGVTIDLEAFQLPNTTNNLIVEGAGGLMVPLNGEELIIDLIKQLNLETILVVNNYLGSINHTLLSIQVLKQKSINVIGIIFNGETNPESEKYILKYSGIPCLGRIKKHQKISKEIVLSYKETFIGL
jgi:dethiobiotin synthetase